MACINVHPLEGLLGDQFSHVGQMDDSKREKKKGGKGAWVSLFSVDVQPI